MAKKYLGIVLTTRRYDMYRFVVYQYEDTAMVNTCPLCQLLRAIHAYSKEYMEEQREIRGYVPRRRWFNLDNSLPGYALHEYGLTQCAEMSFEPCRIMPVTYFKVKPESAMYKNFFIENTERKKLKKHISEFMKNHFGNGKHEVWTTLYPSLVMTLSSEKAKELSH